MRAERQRSTLIPSPPHQGAGEQGLWSRRGEESRKWGKRDGVEVRTLDHEQEDLEEMIDDGTLDALPHVLCPSACQLILLKPRNQEGPGPHTAAKRSSLIRAASRLSSLISRSLFSLSASFSSRLLLGSRTARSRSCSRSTSLLL